MRAEEMEQERVEGRGRVSWSSLTQKLEQRSAVQFEKIQCWVKKVSGVWGNVDGERRRCPRCKGSGLNMPQASLFGWKQAAQSEEACWFCEGVGVMPIVGLTGFVMARSSPMISTRDLKPRPRLPIKVQLYLGKFPGTKCKIRFHKPCLDMADLLHDPFKPPAWSELEPELSGFDGGTAFSEDALSDRAFLMPVRDRSGNSPKMATSPRSPSLSKTPRQEWSAGRTRSAWRTPSKPTPGVPQHSRIAHRSSPRSSPSSPATHDAAVSPKQRGSLHGKSTSSSAGNSNPLTPGTSSGAGTPTRHDTAGSDSEFGTGSFLRPPPLISSPRSAKSPRKERNRIREKAEKEAMERARRFQRPLRAAYSLTKPADQGPESKWYIKAGEWLHKTSSKGELPSPASSSTGFQYRDIPWINNLVYGKLKDNMKNAFNASKPAKVV